MTPVDTIVLLVAAVACAIDLRVRRIPNRLTFGAAAAGLLYHTMTGGASGLLAAASGWVIGGAIFFLPFALGGLGAGDIKLLAALGAWLGPSDTVWLSLFTGVAGGVLAVGVSLFHGYLREALRNVWMLLMHWRVAGIRPLPELTLEAQRGPKLAYGVAVLAGTVVTLWAH